jgi:hypothetical protein
VVTFVGQRRHSYGHVSLFVGEGSHNYGNVFFWNLPFVEQGSPLLYTITVTFFPMVGIASEDDDDAIECHGDLVTH